MRYLLLVGIALVMLAVPAMAHDGDEVGDDNEILMIGESADGETVVIYEDPSGEVVVIRGVAVADEPRDSYETERESVEIDFGGFGHADYRYPDGGPGEALVDRLQLQWTVGRGPWSVKYKVDYRDKSRNLEFGELSLRYTDPGGKWWTIVGREIFVYANTPAPHANRFNGYSDNLGGIITAPGLMVGTKIGDINWGAGWLASDGRTRGRYDGFALTASGTAPSGVYASALGYWATDIELWSVDTTVPLDNRGSHLQFSAAGDEGAAKAHGYWLGTSLSLDDEEHWWLNAGYDHGWQDGTEYETIPISVNYDWPRQEGEVTMRTTLGCRMNQITGEDNWSLRFQFPLAGLEL